MWVCPWSNSQFGMFWSFIPTCTLLYLKFAFILLSTRYCAAHQIMSLLYTTMSVVILFNSHISQLLFTFNSIIAIYYNLHWMQTRFCENIFFNCYQSSHTLSHLNITQTKFCENIFFPLYQSVNLLWLHPLLLWLAIPQSLYCCY